MASAIEQAVYDAADELMRRGQRVTVRTVREFLGGGSFTTLTPILKNWRQLRAGSRAALGGESQDDFARVIDEAVARAVAEVRRRHADAVASVHVAHGAVLAERAEELSEALEEVVRLEAELAKAQEVSERWKRRKEAADLRATQDRQIALEALTRSRFGPCARRHRFRRGATECCLDRSGKRQSDTAQCARRQETNGTPSTTITTPR